MMSVLRSCLSASGTIVIGVLAVGAALLYSSMQYSACWAISEGLGALLGQDTSLEEDVERRKFLKEYAARYNEENQLPMVMDDETVLTSVSALGTTFIINISMPLVEEELDAAGMKEFTRILMQERSELAAEACQSELEGMLLEAGFNVRFAYSAGDQGRVGAVLLRPEDCG